eukprot:XP_001692235.1 WD-repeat protein of flagellum central pair [Chlamydomonas reinhardtii]
MAAAGLDTLRLEDSDDDFKYEEVDVMSDGEDDASEDLDAALRKLQQFTSKQEAATGPARTTEVKPGQVVKKPEVIDDFLRNFFIKMGLSRTCECFEAEWYELKATGRLDNSTTVPDVYLRNAELEDDVAGLRRELAEAKSIAGRASATWDKFRKERDFHRMHHKRVAQEKNKLLTDLRRLKEHYAKYEPTILELKKKYETLMKEKMMMSLERDKLAARVDALEQVASSPLPGAERSLGGQSTAAAGGGASGRALGATNGALTGDVPPAAGAAAAAATGRSGAVSAGPRSGWASLNAPPRRNPYADLEFPAAPVKMLSLNKTFKGHLLSVANLALHPTKPILVTASDDKTWKMWHMPGAAGGRVQAAGWCKEAGLNGGLVLWGCGGGAGLGIQGWFWVETSPAPSLRLPQTYYGHQNSCNGVSFNILGTQLASTDADGVVKLWDTRMTAEVATINTGKRLWRMGRQIGKRNERARIWVWVWVWVNAGAELAGHEDAVQAVLFDPAGQYLVSCGSDNTFRLWS